MICGGRSLSFTQFGCQEIDLQGHAKRGWSRREEVAAARVGPRFIWANAQCGCREALSAAGYRAPRRSGTGPSRPIGARSNACDAVRRRVRGCAWGAAKLSRYGAAIAQWQFDVIRCLAIGRHNPRGSAGALCRGVRRTPAAWHESPQRNCLAADSRGASPSGSASSGRSNGSDLGSDPFDGSDPLDPLRSDLRSSRVGFARWGLTPCARQHCFAQLPPNDETPNHTE